MSNKPSKGVTKELLGVPFIIIFSLDGPKKVEEDTSFVLSYL